MGLMEEGNCLELSLYSLAILIERQTSRIGDSLLADFYIDKPIAGKGALVSLADRHSQGGDYIFIWAICRVILAVFGRREVKKYFNLFYKF